MRRAALAASLVAAMGAAQPALGADSLAVVAPIARPGPYPVACSNVAQDFGRLGPLETASEYWRGLPRSDGTPRYATDLLSEAADALVYAYAVPVDDELFGRYGGTAVSDLAIVCYPTTTANARADYPLPNGNLVPRMQRAGDAPILPPGGPWPVVLHSHGYAGSPLDGTYLGAMLTLASFGYVTAAPFHGDPRWSLLGFEAIFEEGIAGEALWRDYVAMQAIRPVGASALLDALGAHPHWRDALDLARVGGFGISQGGSTLMLMGGAALTTSVFQASRPIGADPRLAAAAGYIPYFGLSFLPSFGRNQSGVDGVVLPYLAIAGGSDPLADFDRVVQGIDRLGSTRSLVVLEGVGHDLDPPYPDDVFTWAIVFLDAQLRGNREANAKLQRMTAVAGGGNDRRTSDYTSPLPPVGDERGVVEFHHAGFDHYFVTAEPGEIAGLDAGSPPGWRRTGYTFKALDGAAAASLPSCRYYGVFGALATHFYSILPNECADLAANPSWTFETNAFRADAPAANDCPADAMLVTRLYNQGASGAPNHRMLTSANEAARLVSNGWLSEGPVLCARP